MRSSRKKDETRSVFDVGASAQKSGRYSIKSLLYGRNVLNLRQKFRGRHPWITTIVLTLGAIVVTVGVRHFLVRADVMDFYPAGCLGTWQSPEKAQGQPESLSENVQIDVTNAAVSNRSSSQIFCGNFIPADVEKPGDIQNIGLTLVWNITGLPSVVSSSTTSTEIIAPTSTAPTSTSATSTDDVSSSPPAAFNFRFSPLSLLRLIAYAQEASGTTTEGTTTTDITSATPATTTMVAGTDDTTDATGTPAIDSLRTTTDTTATATVTSTTATSTDITSTIPVTTTIELGPPLTAELSAVATGTTSTVDAAATSSPVVPSGDVPDDTFLLVSYSTDGNTWVPLRKIGASNWQRFTVAVPIVNWDDLKKLQIKIEAIPTTLQDAPTVFLDGSFIEVTYEAAALAPAPVIQPAAQPVSVTNLIEDTQDTLRNAIHADVIVSPQFQAANDWIAYKADGGGEADIYIRNGLTGEIRRVTNTPFDESEPVAANGRVAWAYATGYEGSQLGEIYLYDIADDKTTQITHDMFLDQSPRFEDGSLVWDKFDAVSVAHRFAYDLATGEITQRDTVPFVTSAPPAPSDGG